MLIEVTSELEVPSQIDAIEVLVTGDVAGSMVNRTYELSTPWPHTISVRPGETETQGVTIQVTARLGGGFVAQRLVRSAFVSGEEVVVRIDLPASCVSVVCDTGEDCRDGTCVPIGGNMDAGPMDAGTDSGPMDTGVDAGCSSAAECNDDVPCTQDTCQDGACVNEPDDTLCEVGSTCDPVDGCPLRACVMDSDCSDGVVCNGTEVCASMSCAPGVVIDCNDGDTCTSDQCDESMRGACLHTTKDADGDGFGDSMCAETGGVPATDCNDTNPDVNPMAPETCNGIDDDCMNGCDDPFTCCRGEIGMCTTSCGTTGTRVCNTSCAWDVCAPPAETCNGVDDDCNGSADDVFACVQGATETCTTGCGSPGTRTCLTDCSWSACMAPAETCNGGDDDCDMSVDEDFACVRGTSTGCTTSCGSTGSRTCDTSCTLGSCTPPPEGCNGVDDDCDGAVDETSECMPGTTGTCVTSCGSTGMRTCGSTCVYGTCNPPAETCNSIDDDCDGRIDETSTCIPGTTGSCTTGCGTAGIRTCSASCSWSACAPPIEACNGLDDDCDTMCDETFTCCAGTSGSCTTSCGTTGSRTCTSSCGWSACSPPAEVCNGMDDDCNATCDDGFGCCAGTTGSCTTTCGSTGSRTCSSSCTWGACAVPAEICNGVDDDCDGAIDETQTCIAGEMGSCTTSCGSTGNRTCSGSCAWGSCNPPTEACNGVDDDCDSAVDEGCGGCGSCTGAAAVSAPGGRYNVPLSPNAQTGSCGGAGSEGYLTFTLGSVADVFITTHQAGSMDTVLYVRDCNCTGAERACNDNADGRTTSMLRLTNLPAGTYNVVVDTKTATSGSVPVDVYISTPGTESDRCGNPTLIPAGGTSISGDTCSFTMDYLPTATVDCDASGVGAGWDRVYYFYLPAAATVSFDGCNSTSNYDETIFIRSVCSSGAAADQVMCMDDNCSGGLGTCGGGRRASRSIALPAGLYYFFADGWGTTSGCACGNFRYDISGI